MKRMSLVTNTLALLLMSLGAVPTANAALKAFSPNLTFDGTPVTTGGMPTWFQGQDNVAVQPCIVAGCGLLPAPPGTFTSGTVVFPTNYPAEAFYFLAQSPKLIPIGASGASLDVFAALEFTTIDPLNPAVPGVAPTTPGVVLGTFQRLRFAITGTVAAGNWTVDHPWGTTIFNVPGDCKPKAGGAQCTKDIPVPAPNDFLQTLGPAAPLAPSQFTMDTFLKSTSAPVGFLGDALTTTTFTGGTVRQFFQVTDPAANTTGPITTAIITGKTLGLEVTPATTINLGAVTVPGSSAPQTVTVNNVTGAAINFGVLATAGTNPGDFAISANTCGANVAAGASCTFAVTFTPAATPNNTAARTATILLAPTTVQPAPPPAAQLPDPPPITMSLSGTAQFPLTVTIATPVPPNTGTGTVASNPAGLTCSAGTCNTPAFPAGSTVTLTATPAAGSAFDSWSGTGATACTTATPCTVTMNGATSVTANFITGFTLATSATPTAGGTITPTQAVVLGNSRTLTVTPNACYHLTNFTDNGTPASAVPVPNTTSFSYLLANITADHTVAATFSNQRNVTKSVGVNGAMTGPSVVTCGATDTVFTITPNAKFKVRSITVNNVDKTPATIPDGPINVPIALIADADQTVAATFMPSGDLDGNGKLEVADALKALKIAIGIQAPVGDDTQAMDVAPLLNGKPGGGNGLDVGDVLTILKRVVNVITW